MAAAVVIEDMRSVDPVGYIRAVGLRPEDSYGFLPIDLSEATSYFFLYRDRPEYEEARFKLPGAQSVSQYGPLEVAPVSLETDIPAGGLGGGLDNMIAQAQQMQQQWAGQGIPGGPGDQDAARIETLDHLRSVGAISQPEYDDLVSEVRGGSAGPTPGGAPAAAAATNAPPIVMHRIYPDLRKRSSTRQLDHFMPGYRDALGLCPEDVYGVFPVQTRTSVSESNSTEWDDYWIVYRDRPEYEQGRQAWARQMNEKGDWPAAELSPGVAGASGAVYDRAKVKVEKNRWPREKLVMRKQGSDLGDALREKIGKWDYGPEDSLGFCPDFDNSAIYFAWRKPQLR